MARAEFVLNTAECCSHFEIGHSELIIRYSFIIEH